MKKAYEKMWLVVCLAIFLPACGGGGGGSSEVPLESACQETNKVFCDVFERCELVYVTEMENHSQCEDANFFCDDDFNRMVEAVKAGRMAYDGKLARTCLDKISQTKCSEIFTIFEMLEKECGEVFTGLVSENGNCYQDDECQNGLYCDESEQKCPGTCKPRAAQNESCADVPCLEELSCNEDDTCVPPAGNGQSCLSVRCQDELQCDYSQAPPICVVPGDAGSSCTDEDQCKPGLRCLNDKCTGQAAVGETCIIEESMDLIFACQTGNWCDADILHQQKEGTCKPKKNQGEECLLPVECKPGLLCIGVQINQQTGEVTKGKCQPPLSENQSCNVQLAKEHIPECNYDLWCNPNSGKCEKLPAEGGTCSTDVGCNSDNLICDVPIGEDLGTCKKLKAYGEGCQFDQECYKGYCSDQMVCRSYDQCTP